MPAALALAAALNSAPRFLKVTGVAYPIAVEITSSGPTQEQFAYQIRELVRASHTFRFVNAGEPGFRLRIAMMDGPSPNGIIVYSYALSFAYRTQTGALTDLYLYTLPGYCGVQITQTCAETIVARASQQAETVIDTVSEAQTPSQ